MQQGPLNSSRHWESLFVTWVAAKTEFLSPEFRMEEVRVYGKSGEQELIYSGSPWAIQGRSLAWRLRHCSVLQCPLWEPLCLSPGSILIELPANVHPECRQLMPQVPEFLLPMWETQRGTLVLVLTWLNSSCFGHLGDESVDGRTFFQTSKKKVIIIILIVRYPMV